MDSHRRTIDSTTNCRIQWYQLVAAVAMPCIDAIASACCHSQMLCTSTKNQIQCCFPNRSWRPRPPALLPWRGVDRARAVQQPTRWFHHLWNGARFEGVSSTQPAACCAQHFWNDAVPMARCWPRQPAAACCEGRRWNAVVNVAPAPRSWLPVTLVDGRDGMWAHSK